MFIMSIKKENIDVGGEKPINDVSLGFTDEIKLGAEARHATAFEHETTFLEAV